MKTHSRRSSFSSQVLTAPLAECDGNSAVRIPFVSSTGLTQGGGHPWPVTRFLLHGNDPAAGVNVGEKVDERLQSFGLPFPRALVRNFGGQLLADSTFPSNQWPYLAIEGHQSLTEWRGDGGHDVHDRHHTSIYGSNFPSKYALPPAASKDAELAYRPYMDEKDDGTRARDILARNLNHLIETGQTTFARLVKAEAGTLGTLSRVRNAKSSAGVDQLDRLGYALDLEAWQLIHPAPSIAEMSPEQRSVLEEIGLKLAALPPAALQKAAALCSLALDVAAKDVPPAEPEPSQPPPRGAARSGPLHPVPKPVPPKAR